MKFKKFLAIFCSTLFLMASIYIPATAETNHCGEFKDFISSLFLMGLTDGDSPESINGISVYKICEYTFHKSFTTSQYCPSGDDFTYEVEYPAFKTAVEKYFYLGNASAKFDSTVKGGDHYDSATNKITWYLGGYGDSYHYEIDGYVADGNNQFTVYGYGVDIYENDKAPIGSVKGKDYITVTSNGASYDLQICEAYKTVVRINNGILQFVSSEKMSSIPESIKLIKPGDIIKSDGGITSSKTTTVDSNIQKSDNSKNTTPKENTANKVDSNNDNTSSDKLESQEEKKDDDKGVTIELGDNTTVVSIDKYAFLPGTVVKVEKTELKSEIKKVNAAISKKIKVKNITVLEFSAELDGASVQPDKTVEVCVDIPSGYNPQNIAVYYVSPERDEVEEINFAVDTDENMIKMMLEHFSTYVIAEKESSDSDDSLSNKKFDNITVFIIIAAIFLAVLIAAVILIIVFKKKNTVTTPDETELIENKN